MKKNVLLLTGAVVSLALLMGCSKNENDNKASNEYVTVEGYKGIEVGKASGISGVTDSDVDNYINSILEQNSVEITDRSVEAGDVVSVSFAATVDGQGFNGGNGENYSLKIGAGQYLEGFDEGIIGHNIGDVYEWIGILPENYANDPALSGKEALYTISINSILKPAELTDDFVQTVSDQSKTVDEYRAEVKRMLEDDSSVEDNFLLQETVWNAVLEKAVVEKYPEEEVKQISDSLIQQYKDMAKNESLDYESYIEKQMGLSVPEFETQAVEAAKIDIKQRLVAEVIGDKEKILPGEDEMETEYQKLAEQYGYPDVDTMKEMAGEDDLKTLIIQNRVKEWLAANCVQSSE